MTAPASPFRLALTADFFDAAGQPRYADYGQGLLDERGAHELPRIDLRRMDRHEPELAPGQLSGANGVIVLTPRVTARSLAESDELVAIGRFGVGYDSVDVAACTERDVALFITAGAVDWSVAEATVGWMLALTHHVRVKDRLVREGQWDARSQWMGSELRERTLGIVGFGGIGRAVVEQLRSFCMQTPLVFDPYLSDDQAAAAGVRRVPLDELLSSADFVSLHCPLNESTRGLIGARELARMKPTAYLINTARGGIVDEEALFDALQQRRIAGAALDCFAVEPLPGPSRFAALDNVLLAPHSIAWTHELFRDIGRSAFQGMLDFARGETPRGIVNREVLERPGFRTKWSRIVQQCRGA